MSTPSQSTSFYHFYYQYVYYVLASYFTVHSHIAKFPSPQFPLPPTLSPELSTFRLHFRLNLKSVLTSNLTLIMSFWLLKNVHQFLYTLLLTLSVCLLTVINFTPFSPNPISPLLKKSSLDEQHSN